MEYVKQSMNQVWASAGDVAMPDNAKIQEGWLVEVPPRQYWNWMQNRADTNLAYIFQRGIPEWDNTVEYLANKSFVVYNGVTYKAILTGTNQNPSTATTYWQRAFATHTTALDALGSVTPAADRYVYFNGTSTATLGTITAFARTILDDADAATVRTTIGAQPLDATLTSMAGVTTAANKFIYFTGVDTAAAADITAFARTMLDDADAASVRTTIGAQPLDATLTALAGVTTAADRLIYATGADTFTVTPLTSFARSILDDADAVTVRGTISAQAADPTLTALAGVSSAADTIAYFTGVDTAAVTTLSSFGRTLIDDANAATARATLGLQSGATTAVGTIATQNTNSVVITGGSISGITDLAIADGGTGASDAAGARLNLGLGTAAVTNVTTSQTDATAGRVVKVGDFGENGGSVLTGTSGDLNTYTSHGFWIIGTGAVTITNSPDNSTIWILEVRKFATTLEANGVVQFAYRRNGVEMWQRSYMNNGWTQWSQKVGHQMGWQVLDLNSITNSGFYNIDGSNSLNLPTPGGVYGHLIVHNVDGNNAAQKFIVAGDVNQYREYSRVKSGGIWQPWYETWTTSNLVKTASATDTTAGSMLKVGDFGLGAVTVPYTSDLNTIAATGVYKFGSSTLSLPSGAQFGTVQHNSYGQASGNWTQLLVGTTPNRSWVRSNVNGTIQPWVEVWTSSNQLSIGTTAASARAAIGIGNVVDKAQCTAWVNFNGTGTVAIRDSYNVSSITDINTGRYKVNFSSDMVNTNYVTSGSCGDGDTTTSAGRFVKLGLPETNGAGICIVTDAGAFADVTYISLEFFGGK